MWDKDSCLPHALMFVIQCEKVKMECTNDVE